tara:strand:+ start:2856 stop:3326 length:471 start_codon:yes stop_codon:yes gene_type:complete
MAYLDVISLADAKNYLRVDDTLTDDDAQISRMIKSALSTIEKRTNVLVYSRSKSYLFQDYCVRVYDFPINSLTSPTDAEVENKALHTNYEASKTTDVTLVLNVGYVDPLDVPYELIDCALQYVKYLYYEAETDKANKGMLPYWLQDMMNQNKRYLL